MLSRRDLARISSVVTAAFALRRKEAALFATEKLESTVRGVKLGLITGSISAGGRGARGPAQPLTVDAIIDACQAVGAANVEYSGPTVGMPTLVDGVIGQPPAVLTDAYRQSREAVRQWRLSAPLEPFREARSKFNAAGLNWFSGVNTIPEDSTDAEIDALFRQMAAMQVKIFCTNQTRMSTAPRLVPFAEKYGIMPAFHTHDKYEDPNEVASAESLVKLMAMSPLFRINLDIGHFTAGNQDAPAFIEAHYDRITHLHVKDRKRNHGPNVAWGTGDTPIVQCLRLIRDRRYQIYDIVEREYRGSNDGTPVEETKKCMQYMIDALNS